MSHSWVKTRSFEGPNTELAKVVSFHSCIIGGVRGVQYISEQGPKKFANMGRWGRCRVSDMSQSRSQRRNAGMLLRNALLAS